MKRRVSICSGLAASLETTRKSTPFMPTIGRLNVTIRSPVSPGLMVAELATAVTPQAQEVVSKGSGFISLTCRGAPPEFVNAQRYSILLL